MLFSLLRAARLLCEDSTPLLSRVSQVSTNPCQDQDKLTRLLNKPVLTMGFLELIHAFAQPGMLLASAVSIHRGCCCPYTGAVIPLLVRDAQQRHVDLHGT